MMQLRRHRTMLKITPTDSGRKQEGKIEAARKFTTFP
jgi:hypothetical protein